MRTILSLLTIAASLEVIVIYAGNKPNIVLILVDDMAWSNLGCYGNKYIDTPHIDRLASQGMRFTNAYAPAPICSASRASILTGKSTARLHFEFVTKDDSYMHPPDTQMIQPPITQDLTLEEVTFAEMARDAGYHTAMFGKWHLTQQTDQHLGWGNTHGPLQQGFETGSADKGSHPYSYWEIRPMRFGKYQQNEYPKDALTENAIGFLKQEHDKPFLLFVSHYYVHSPAHTKCKWLYDKYKSRLGESATGKEIHFAAMVETLDHYIGLLLEALESTGLGENTFVIFTSDNGGQPDLTHNLPFRGEKWLLYEGGIRVPMIVRWPGVVNARSTSDIPVTGTDLFGTFKEIMGATSGYSDNLDGESLVPILRGLVDSRWEERELIWHFPYYHTRMNDTCPQSAIRKGNYKLIYYYEDDRSELFNLGEDLSEENNLSSRLSNEVEDLKDRLLSYLQSVEARFPVNRE